jgi:Zn-dependent M28 family amino/carboxypeptidase
MQAIPYRTILIALAGALSLGACTRHLEARNPIDPKRLSEHVRVLASDAFEGRGPGTPAEAKVIDYVSGQFKALGLQPAGEHGGWTQDVTLASFQVTGPVKLSFTENGKTLPLTQGEQAVVQTLTPVDHVSIRNAPLVFVGYGVKAPERGWDDFKGVDLHGKIAVVLINDPDFENPASKLFGGPAMTYYGRWTYKYEEAARQGALGMLIVHETRPASYGWATVKNSNINEQFDIVRPDPGNAHPLLQGWIQRDQAVQLFKACGQDFEAARVAARRPDFRPVPLGCASFSADYGVDHRTVVTHNILAMVPGKTRPNDYVIFSAHWDHLGVGQPDARGDRIFNGAVDNASGVADVLEIARAFEQAPPPQRSVLFLIVTAEEKGLLGSLYYAMHPLYPPERTAGVINIDALSATGPARDISVSGGGQVSLEDDLAAVAKRHGRYFSPDPEPGAGHFYRSDHFSFAKIGVPAISIDSGEDLVDGGRKAGKAWAEDYTAKRYHQPADEWSPDMDFTGQAADTDLAYEVGRDLADSDRWPQWKPTSEFRSIRAATDAARR